MGFGTGLTGLRAASEALNVTGNNIANASTAGFKSSRAEFGDMYATAYGGISKRAVGSGVQLQRVTQKFSQGTLENTGNNLDLAVSGKGFFTFSDNGAQLYSRNGALSINRAGYVVNSQGQRLQVYAPTGNTIDGQPQFKQGSLSDLKLAATLGAPQATSSVSLGVNLSAHSPDLGTGTITPSDPSSYTYSTPVTIYDSLGSPHTAIMYFRKDTTTEGNGTSGGSTTWDVLAQVDGKTVGSPAQITFDGNGKLKTPANSEIKLASFTTATGAQPLQISLDLKGTSMFGKSSTVNSLSQNGFATGRLVGIDVNDTGVISARYTNGQSKPLGQVALADFTNPQGLQSIGNTTWAPSFGAGDVRYGVPGDGSFGQIKSGSLENSNVDLAKQLVNMITEQRDYQANAQVIRTANTITQTVLNIHG